MDVSRHDHGVYFSDHDAELVEVLSAYVEEGWAANERVLLVVTQEHLRAVTDALRAAGGDPDGRRTADDLHVLDAGVTLAGFMAGDRPDPELFSRTVGAEVERLGRDGRHVRIFGEMVRLLWDEGNVAGAMAVEKQWNGLAGRLPFTLLCNYPHSVLDQHTLADVGRVCGLHSRVLPPPSYYVHRATTSHSHAERATWALLPVPEAIAAFRRFVKGTLELWGEDELVEDALLVTSEMATNAIRHARSAFHASVVRAGRTVRISIQDTGPGTASPRQAADDDLSGRGLVILDALAQRWGVEERVGGKAVWAELRSSTPTA